MTWYSNTSCTIINTYNQNVAINHFSSSYLVHTKSEGVGTYNSEPVH